MLPHAALLVRLLRCVSLCVRHASCSIPMFCLAVSLTDDEGCIWPGSSVAALSLSRPVAISRAGLANRSGLTTVEAEALCLFGCAHQPSQLHLHLHLGVFAATQPFHHTGRTFICSRKPLTQSGIPSRVSRQPTRPSRRLTALPPAASGVC